MALKFLFDECVALSLVQLAHARGFEAYHVAHRGWAGQPDHELLNALLEGELTLVTNNGPDFTALLGRADSVHPGLVVLVTQVRPSAQALLFGAVLDHLAGRDDLTNRLIEVDLDEESKQAITGHQRLSAQQWQQIEAGMAPIVTETELPHSST